MFHHYSTTSKESGMRNFLSFFSIAVQPALRIISKICAWAKPVSSEIFDTVSLTEELKRSDNGLLSGFFLLMQTTDNYK